MIDVGEWGRERSLIFNLGDKSRERMLLSKIGNLGEKEDLKGVVKAGN